MGKENLTKKPQVKKVRNNICPSSMADSDPARFTTRPFTRANSGMCSRNYHSNSYMRSACKLLFFTFFLVAIPLFPSQPPDFINQTVFNKFWELVHLMFIGIAVSYGLFCRRSVEFDDSNLDDSQFSASGMFHVSSIFEDGFSNSMYYSGQGNAGFLNVKNGSFENPNQENVVQAWSSKYLKGEPKVVLAQPNCGIEKYGQSESSSCVDYKPLGLPVRSLKSRAVTRVRPEFVDGSSESSGSRMKDSSDSYNKSRSGSFGDLGSEDLEVKFNESEVLSSPIPWRSRSGRMRERVRSDVARRSHFRPLSVDETQFESLKSRSLRSTVSFSSQVGSQSPSPNSLSPSHSSSSESPKSKMSEVVKERSHRRSIPPPSPSVPKPMSTKAPVDETQFESLKSRSLRSTVSFSSQVSSQSPSPTSLSPSHSSSSESPKSKMSELVREWSPGRSFPPPPSVLKPMSSEAPIYGTQFESLRPQILRSTDSLSSQVSSLSPSLTSLSPSHSSSESPKPKMSELVKERSPGRSFPSPSPSVPKPMKGKVSVNASHAQQYSDGSLLGTPAWECFKDELKEFCDSEKDVSSGSKERISGSFKFDAKPAAPSKAPSRGKSVRTFRSFRASFRARDAGDKQEDCTKGKLTTRSDKIEEAYTGETEPNIEGHNNLSVGFNRQNLGGESHMPKPTSPESQKREIRDYPENPAVERGEDSETENDDFQVSSDEETMSGTFSIAGSEVDRKAGEFIAKFKEQIRLQRTSSIDTQSGISITGNYFR